MLNPVDVWQAEHVHFERLLDFLEQQIAAFHDGKDPNYELMRDVVHYLRHYGDHYHHPREDVAFDRLVKHDAALAPAINMCVQGHRVLAESGAMLLKYLDDILTDAVIERSTVEATAATYIAYYRHHIAEETQVIPRASNLLTRDDWAAVAAAVPAARDPLFGGDVTARYRDLRQQIVREGLLQ